MKVQAVIVPLYLKISKVDQNPSVHSSIFCFTSVVILTSVAGITTLEYYKEGQDSPCAKMGLPRWLSGKNPPANAGDAGDTGSIPGLGKSPGVGNGNLPQCSCLENPPEEPGGLQSTGFHRVAQDWATHTHAKVTHKFVKLPCFCVLNDFFLWVLMAHVYTLAVILLYYNGLLLCPATELLKETGNYFFVSIVASILPSF